VFPEFDFLFVKNLTKCGGARMKSPDETAQMPVRTPRPRHRARPRARDLREQLEGAFAPRENPVMQRDCWSRK